MLLRRRRWAGRTSASPGRDTARGGGGHVHENVFADTAAVAPAANRSEGIRMHARHVDRVQQRQGRIIDEYLLEVGEARP